MKIHESAENYLEAILMIKNRKGSVRSIDIANELSFSKPSVSICHENLRENGYISIDADGMISLEPPGQQIAEKNIRKAYAPQRLVRAARCGSKDRRRRCLPDRTCHQCRKFEAIKDHAKKRCPDRYGRFPGACILPSSKHPCSTCIAASATPAMVSRFMSLLVLF